MKLARPKHLLFVLSTVMVTVGLRASAQKPGVVSVENAGLLFTDNQAGVSGTDAGYSIPIGSRTLWLFGDCFLLDPTSPKRSYVGAVSNCGLLAPKGKGAATLRRYAFLTDPGTGLARQLLSSTTAVHKDLRFWPFGGCFEEASKRVYLFHARIRVTGGGGPFDFRTEGFGLAKADASSPTSIRFKIVPGASGDEIWWPHEDGKAVFGSAVITPPTLPRHRLVDPASLYVVGFQKRGGRTYGKLARVPKARIEDRTAYEYYAGGDPPSWVPDSASAVDIAGLNDFPTELSVAYNAYLGGYLAVHSVGTSEKIRLSLSVLPWGPYRQIAEIGAPHQALARSFCYAGKEHPELAEGNGRVIYVTYVDQHRYWLQLLKVTLAHPGDRSSSSR